MPENPYKSPESEGDLIKSRFLGLMGLLWMIGCGMFYTSIGLGLVFSENPAEVLFGLWISGTGIWVCVSTLGALIFH